MKKRFGFLLFCFLSSFSFAQGYTVTELTSLSNDLFECSGLIYLDERLIGHMDSGDDSYLYEIDSVDGGINRVVFVDNSSSWDWEDITKDEDYIYVADIGNNSGDRTNLMIFRISVSDYLTTPNDTVVADTIYFSYEDQTDFTPSVYDTNFDAEGLISIGDSLYIFTKNWIDNETNIYVLPKVPGTYEAELIDNLNTEGLVTGASRNPNNGNIALCGHTLTTPFVVLIRNLSGQDFSSANFLRLTPPINESIQVEGIAAIGNGCYYLASEDNITGDATLHRICLASNVGIDQNTKEALYFHPNPAQHYITLNTDQFERTELYDLSGKLIFQTQEKTIDVRPFKGGNYIVKAYFKNHQMVQQQIVIE